MMTRTLTRWQALMACGMMLAAGALAPQMVAACGGGRPPALSNVVVSPGETAAIVSFDTEIARDTALVLWPTDNPQSRFTFSDSSTMTQHIFKVATLQPDTRYHYEIRLLDPAGGSYVEFASDLHTRSLSGQGAADGSDGGDAVSDGA